MNKNKLFGKNSPRLFILILLFRIRTDPIVIRYFQVKIVYISPFHLWFGYCYLACFRVRFLNLCTCTLCVQTINRDKNIYFFLCFVYDKCTCTIFVDILKSECVTGVRTQQGVKFLKVKSVPLRYYLM